MCIDILSRYNHKMTVDISHLAERALWPHFRVDCDAGWHQLIVDTHAKLVELDPNYQIAQIKEKFGGLRYYYDTGASASVEYAMRMIVTKAEILSSSICEITGLPGELMVKGGQYKTLNREIYEPQGWTARK